MFTVNVYSERANASSSRSRTQESPITLSVHAGRQDLQACEDPIFSTCGRSRFARFWKGPCRDYIERAPMLYDIYRNASISEYQVTLA